jgi:hypothetical protein
MVPRLKYFVCPLRCLLTLMTWPIRPDLRNQHDMTIYSVRVRPARVVIVLRLRKKIRRMTFEDASRFEDGIVDAAQRRRPELRCSQDYSDFTESTVLRQMSGETRMERLNMPKAFQFSCAKLFPPTLLCFPCSCICFARSYPFRAFR